MRAPEAIRNASPVDIATALALTLATQVEIWAPWSMVGTGTIEGSRAVLGVTALALTLPLALRQTVPFVSNVIVAGAFALQGLLTTPTQGLAELIALLLSFYSVAAHAPRREALASALLGVGAAAAVAQDLADFTFTLILTAAAWTIGLRMHRRGATVRALDERTRELERERDEAASLERARIARELHDIVAHRVSTIVVQAQVAETRLASDPAAARKAMQAIDEGGRQALGELRSLLGLLRDPAGSSDRGPQPGLDRIGELIEETRTAGVPVELRIEGAPYELPPGIGLAAYRIAQEALTNVIKHAGSPRTEVVLDYAADGLHVSIANEGNRPANGSDGGHGLIGIRERVALYGGTLRAEARPEGGFVVHALLPVETTA